MFSRNLVYGPPPKRSLAECTKMPAPRDGFVTADVQGAGQPAGFAGSSARSSLRLTLSARFGPRPLPSTKPSETTPDTKPSEGFRRTASRWARWQVPRDATHQKPRATGGGVLIAEPDGAQRATDRR